MALPLLGEVVLIGIGFSLWLNEFEVTLLECQRAEGSRKEALDS